MKGIVALANDESILVTHSLSDMSFSPSGCFMAVVTGRLVQVSPTFRAILICSHAHRLHLTS